MNLASVNTTKSNNDPRLEQARDWLMNQGVDLQSDFLDIAGDASFRRYFRITADGKSRVLMDAAPPCDGILSFIDIADRLSRAHLHAPEIVLADTQNGFLLLEDLGDDLFRGVLNKTNVNLVFPVLFDLLKRFSTAVPTNNLPEYDARKLRFELNLFPDWYLGHHRTTVPRLQFNMAWETFCDCIVQSALIQPQCFVHRDFHSCNLLKMTSADIGIIDFQDAVNGPVSYDLVSLIWDRYISWPREQLEFWIETFRQHMDLQIEPGVWLKYCDLMGLQRNIKIVGIFSRLHYRDGKKGYIEMIPRFFEYITSTMSHYPEFAEILSIMEQPECAP